MNDDDSSTRNEAQTDQHAPLSNSPVESQPQEPPAPDLPPNVIKDDTKEPRIHPQESQQETAKPEDKSTNRITASDRWIIGLTVIIALSGLAGAVIIYWQLKVMEGQLTEMRNGSADTKALAEAAKQQAENTAKLVALSQDPVIYVHAPDNGPFLYKDAKGKYPVFFTNSGHTGLEEVRVHYSRMAIEETDRSGNLSLHQSSGMSDLNGIEKIDPGQTILFKFDFNNTILHKVQFNIDYSTKVHLEFFYVKITYRRELDNKLFSIEKAYYRPTDKNDSRLAESEVSGFYEPSEEIITSVRNVIQPLLDIKRRGAR
jgi:hypothetical protein